METGKDWTIVFDGGSKGNPGHGYGSYVLMRGDSIVARDALNYSEQGQKVTNNEAEYLTLINAFERLESLLEGAAPSTNVVVNGDSLLVISQLKGTWKVKTESLRPYHARASALLKRFARVTLQWHDRSNSVRILGH